MRRQIKHATKSPNHNIENMSGGRKVYYYVALGLFVFELSLNMDLQTTHTHGQQNVASCNVVELMASTLPFVAINLSSC